MEKIGVFFEKLPFSQTSPFSQIVKFGYRISAVYLSAMAASRQGTKRSRQGPEERTASFTYATAPPPKKGGEPSGSVYLYIKECTIRSTGETPSSPKASAFKEVISPPNTPIVQEKHAVLAQDPTTPADLQQTAQSNAPHSEDKKGQDKQPTQTNFKMKFTKPPANCVWRRGTRLY